MSIAPDLVYPPRTTRPKILLSDEHLDHIAGALDDIFLIPGTRIRFGLDAIIGWIPGIGDALAAIASFILVFAAWRRRAPRITVLRMVLNVVLEMTLGAIPVIGDVFHVAWKCNRRNYRLLTRLRETPGAHSVGDWLFVVLIFTAFAAIAATPFLLFLWMAHLRHWY